MKKLIIYFKEISARIDSAMTLQVLNDYGHLSNFNNKVIIPIYAKTSYEIDQIHDFLVEKKFNNLHLIVLPKSHKIIRSLFLIAYVLSFLSQKEFMQKVIVVREKKYLWLAKFIKRIFNALLLVEFHETSLPEKETKKLHTKHQRLLVNIDGALFTNHSQADYFKAYKYEMPKNKLILPNGLSVKNYSKVKGASFKSRPVILTYTGQFTQWKNVPLIFEALQHLPSYFHLRIAGGKENSEISNLLKANSVNDIIHADCAEPKSIAELNSYGHNVLPVSKGKDSILYGINLINQNKIYVTSRSKNLINELNNYIWLTDKSGVKMNKPIDSYNHAIDAMRYAITSQLENPNKGNYFIY
jgi:glycosyltransferase involved in cell wall biosynthesis